MLWAIVSRLDALGCLEKGCFEKAALVLCMSRVVQKACGGLATGFQLLILSVF